MNNESKLDKNFTPIALELGITPPLIRLLRSGNIINPSPTNTSQHKDD